MATAIDNYYKQLQTLNEQRRMTGNATLNRGMDASLAEGYMDAQYNQQNKQQAINLQRQGQQQAAYQFEKNRDDQKSAQTTNLIGSAVGGVAKLGMEAYQISKKADMFKNLFPTNNIPAQVAVTDPYAVTSSLENAELDKQLAQPSMWDDFYGGAKDIYSSATSWLSDMFSF